MSSFEIILTVMNDIRSNTLYGDPTIKDVVYYPRLVLNDENNIGKCRHMADKFTKIMNLIDPRFEAYNLSVKIGDLSEFVMCNIDRPDYVETKDAILINIENLNANIDEEITDTSIIDTIENSTEEIKTFILNQFGDHEVSILKPIGEDYYLVVDVTNPSIGVIDNGEIYMFNSHKYTTFAYSRISQFDISINHTFLYVEDVFLSSRNNNLNIDELNEKYGVKEQNKMLRKIKKEIKEN